jgi:hypothetical protein
MADHDVVAFWIHANRNIKNVTIPAPSPYFHGIPKDSMMNGTDLNDQIRAKSKYSIVTGPYNVLYESRIVALYDLDNKPGTPACHLHIGQEVTTAMGPVINLSSSQVDYDKTYTHYHRVPKDSASTATYHAAVGR